MDYKEVVGGWIVFYVLVALLTSRTDERIFDFITYIALFTIIFILGKAIVIPVASIWFFGLGTLWHMVGILPFSVNGNTTSLYALVAHYDTIGHFTGFFLFTIGFFYLYHANRSNVSKLDIVVMLLALVGVGALIETSEYLGYRLFGFGEGWIKFGDGDNSMNFGPWGDSMTDTISNILGVFTGFTSYILIKCKSQFFRNTISNKIKKLKKLNLFGEKVDFQLKANVYKPS